MNSHKTPDNSLSIEPNSIEKDPQPHTDSLVQDESHQTKLLEEEIQEANKFFDALLTMPYRDFYKFFQNSGKNNKPTDINHLNVKPENNTVLVIVANEIKKVTMLTDKMKKVGHDLYMPDIYLRRYSINSNRVIIIIKPKEDKLIENKETYKEKVKTKVMRYADKQWMTDSANLFTFITLENPILSSFVKNKGGGLSDLDNVKIQSIIEHAIKQQTEKNTSNATISNSPTTIWKNPVDQEALLEQDDTNSLAKRRKITQNIF